MRFHTYAWPVSNKECACAVCVCVFERLNLYIYTCLYESSIRTVLKL